MSLIHATDLIRRLRSNGVRVYLDSAGRVTFSSLDSVNPALKAELAASGHALKQRLKEEQELRLQRERMRRKPARKPHIPEVKSEDL